MNDYNYNNNYNYNYNYNSGYISPSASNQNALKVSFKYLVNCWNCVGCILGSIFDVVLEDGVGCILGRCFDVVL